VGCAGGGELRYVCGCAGGCGALPRKLEETGLGPCGTLAVRAGVDGPEEDGEGESTTHIRWDRVATSLATVWARVL